MLCLQAFLRNQIHQNMIAARRIKRTRAKAAGIFTVQVGVRIYKNADSAAALFNQKQATKSEWQP